MLVAADEEPGEVTGVTGGCACLRWVEFVFRDHKRGCLALPGMWGQSMLFQGWRKGRTQGRKRRNRSEDLKASA